MKIKIKKEEWKIHPEFPKYAVSTYGRMYTYHQNKFLRPSINKDGYLFVGLRKNKKSQNTYIHKAVLETFKGKRPEGWVCRHFPDQDKTNNYIDNINWTTQAVNLHDKKEAINCEWLKLTIDQVIEIKYKLKHGAEIEDIATEYDISRPGVTNIKNNKSWNSIGEDISKYNFKRKKLKLSPNDVCLIKILLKDPKYNLTQVKISEMFKVDRSIISVIKTDKHYKKVIPVDIPYDEACIIYNNGRSLLLE